MYNRKNYIQSSLLVNCNVVNDIYIFYRSFLIQDAGNWGLSRNSVDFVCFFFLGRSPITIRT